MRKTTKITTDDVKKLAKLANLTIKDQDSESLRQQLSESLKYVDNLNEIDTAVVPDTFFSTKTVNVWQEDEIDPDVTLPQSEVLKNAKKTKKGYFVVKRIL